jgi:hypothetical protein
MTGRLSLAHGLLFASVELFHNYITKGQGPGQGAGSLGDRGQGAGG